MPECKQTRLLRQYRVKRTETRMLQAGERHDSAEYRHRDFSERVVYRVFNSGRHWHRHGETSQAVLHTT
jgi:hypothetical protein